MANEAQARARTGREPKGGTRFSGFGYLIKRILAVFVFPALVMAGLARVAPNPDGVLLLGLACAFGSGYYLSRKRRLN